jgi:hypothetical protein
MNLPVQLALWEIVVLSPDSNALVGDVVWLKISNQRITGSRPPIMVRI